jgi:hypothetical protein
MIPQTILLILTAPLVSKYSIVALTHTIWMGVNVICLTISQPCCHYCYLPTPLSKHQHYELDYPRSPILPNG